MFRPQKERPSLVKIGIAALAIVWSLPTLLVSATNGPAAPPKGAEDAEMMYNFVFFLYFFFALAVFLVAARWFYKHFLAPGE